MPDITEVGTVAGIYRYPVKSMRGESLKAANVRWTGFDGDRQYAFYKIADKSRFPWLTARDHSELVLFTARFDDENTRTSRVSVTAPGRAAYDVTSSALAALLSEAAKQAIGVLQVGRGIFDSMPISVIGQGTLDALGHTHGNSVENARFRPNIVIDRGRETEWIGGCLIFGSHEDGIRLRVNKPIDRCSLITIDPGNAVRDPGLLRTVVENFQNEIGAYCVPERLGTLVAGSKVWFVRG